MKIICVDNFNRESISDVLVADKVNEHYGPFIVKFLNEKFSGENSRNYFHLVNDTYILYEFKP